MKNAALKFITLLTTLVITTLLVGCWTSPEKEIQEKLAVITLRLKQLEDTASAGDSEVQELLNGAHDKITELNNSITESDFDRAKEILSQLTDQLDKYGTLTGERIKMGLHFYGPITEWRPATTVEYSHLTGREDIEKIGAIKTGLRSLVSLQVENGVVLEIMSESEVLLERNKKQLAINLLHGTLHILSQAKASNITLIQGKLTAQLADETDLELTKSEVSRLNYLANYGGDIAWTVEASSGSLRKLQGLSWTGKTPETQDLAVAPRIESPDNQSTYHIDSGDTAVIPFSWYTQMYNNAYQLQVSDQEHFASRVFDNANLEISEHPLALPVGEYHWRVRGLRKNTQGHLIPGPFSKPLVVYVSNSGLPLASPKESAEATGPKPEVRDFKIETIGSSVIVSGRTDPNMRVKANGISAILDEEGVFRAIIDLEPGVQTIRLLVLNPKTGSEAVIEKKVKI